MQSLKIKTNGAMKTKNFVRLLILAFCMNAGNAQEFISETISYDGETRTYEIYVPASYDGSSATPLLLSFHGGSGTSDDQIALDKLSTIADAENFLVVYPQALGDPNDGGSTNWIHKDPTTVDDVFFVDALIDELDSNYEIDANRIYACGYSLGGEFTFELACRLNNKIAAVAVVARTMQNNTLDNCAPEHPTGVLTILGTDDTISNYDGITWAGVQYYISAAATHSYWADQNNCEASASISDVPNNSNSDGSTVERHTWSTAAGCAYVEELKVIGGGHDWPGTFGNMDIDASEEIWAFVSRYDLNGIIDCTSSFIIESTLEPLTFHLFPNPVREKLTLTMEIPHATLFAIYTSDGTLVQNGTVGANMNNIDLSALSPNLYVLKVGSRAFKFVKVD